MPVTRVLAAASSGRSAPPPADASPPPMNVQPSREEFHRLAAEHTPGRADAEWQQAALGDDPPQRVRRLQRHHTPPRLVLAHVQLHALPGRLQQGLHRRHRHLAETELLGRGAAERDDQPVRRRPRQTGCRLQLGEIEWAGPHGAQHQRGLVDHPDAAYTVHARERYPT